MKHRPFNEIRVMIVRFTKKETPLRRDLLSHLQHLEELLWSLEQEKKSSSSKVD